MSTTTPRAPWPPVLVRGAEAELLGAAPDTTRLLADASSTGGTMTAVRTTLGAGTDGPPPHYHAHSPELFFMLDGSLRVLAGDRIVVVSTGDYLLIPPYTAHAWATPDEVGADVLIIKAPGTERFDYFRMADGIRTGVTAPTALLATQERFDNHFVPNAVWDADRTGGRPDRRLVDFPDLDAPARPRIRPRPN